jgi:hypothetical protein
MRRKAANQPGGKRSRDRAYRENQQEARKLMAMSPSYEHVAKTIHLFEGDAKDRSDESGKRASYEREQCQ